MPIEVWVSPLGNYEVHTFTPEGDATKETWEEWLARMGFTEEGAYRHEENAHRNEETPMERADRISRASAENAKLFEEQGWEFSEEEEGEIDALLERLGIHRQNSDLGA